jgi:hypothetical protein
MGSVVSPGSPFLTEMPACVGTAEIRGSHRAEAAVVGALYLPFFWF